MGKFPTAMLVAMLSLSVSSAFAQEASGAMSQSEMASGTMAKSPMTKKPMKHSHMKKSDSMRMKHEASGAMGQ